MNIGIFIPNFVVMDDILAKYPYYENCPNFGQRLASLIVYSKMRNSTELAEKIFENRKSSTDYANYLSMKKGDADYKSAVDNIRKVIDKHIQKNVNVGIIQLNEYCMAFSCSADYFLGYIDFPTKSDTDICSTIGLDLEIKNGLELVNQQLIYEHHYHYIEMINFLLSHEQTQKILEYMYSFFFGNYTHTKHNTTLIDVYDKENKYCTAIPVAEIDAVFLGMITNLLSIVKETMVKDNPKYKYYGRALTYVTLEDLEKVLSYIKEEKKKAKGEKTLEMYTNLQSVIEQDIHFKTQMNTQATPHSITNIVEYIRQRMFEDIAPIASNKTQTGKD